MEDPNFESFFREKVVSHTIKPSDDLFDRIWERKQKRKRRVLLWMSSAAGLLLLGLSWILVAPKDISNRNAQVSVSKVESSNAVSPEMERGKTYQEKQKNNQIEAASSKSVGPIKPINRDETQAESLKQKNQTREKKIADSNGPNRDVFARPIRRKGRTRQIIIPHFEAASVGKKESIPENNQVLSTDNQTQTIDQQETQVKADSVVQSGSLDSLIALSTDSTIKHPAITPTASVESIPHRKNWFFEFDYGKSLGEGVSLSFTPEMRTVLKEKVALPIDSILYSNNKAVYLKLGYSLNRHWDVSVGLNYTYFQYFDFSLRDTLSGTSLPSSLVPVPTKQIGVPLELSYCGIPFQVHYSRSLGKWYGSVGLEWQYMFLLQSKAIVLESPPIWHATSDNDNSKNTYNHNLFLYGASATLGRTFSQSVSLQAGIHYLRSTGSFWGNNDQGAAKWLEFRMGIRYRW